MPFYDREDKILNALSGEEEVSTEALAKRLFVSAATLRRDLLKLEKKGLIVRKHGKVSIKREQADTKIPFAMRVEERYEEKNAMAHKAVAFIKDGDTVMLDGSTSAYCVIPYLKELKNIIVITSGAKASLLLGHLGITNISSGGRMINGSFSYVGADALAMLSRYNADVAIFSCRGLSDDGVASDNSEEENEIRRMMMKMSKKKILLCDRKKHGKVYLNNLCTRDEVDEIISE